MRERLPEWLRRKVPRESSVETRAIVDKYNLHTVCESAQCPNKSECFSNKTATFMILGDVCTRNCGFCAVQNGDVTPLDSDEPMRVAQAVRDMGLLYVVITSVTRDDLPRGGAEQFAETVHAIKSLVPNAIVEVLIPDCQGNGAALDIICKSPISVCNHNVETVPRLYSMVRPQAEYQRSLNLLKYVKTMYPMIKTKSGIMVGLGESAAEVKGVLLDLQEVDCDIVTIGQYLRPSDDNLAISRFVHPDEFDQYSEYGKSLGIPCVFSGPYVRSSYHADRLSLNQ